MFNLSKNVHKAVMIIIFGCVLFEVCVNFKSKCSDEMFVLSFEMILKL